MIGLGFKTELKLLNENSVSIKWELTNQEIQDQCYHQMDFDINGQSFDDIISGYETTAHQAIFNVIENKFPGIYEL